MAHTVAIDLGTTCCSIAVPEPRVESGFRIVSSVPECSVILDRFGRARIPALVAAGSSGFLIGYDAARMSEAGSAMRFAKRWLVEDASLDPGPAESLSPGQAITHLFRYLKLNAEERLGGAVTSAVIAVSPHFGLREIEIIRRSASEAGLNVMQIVSEPVATVLAYSVAHIAEDCEPLRLLVCNIGGGSFDASIVEQRGEAISVIATDGDRYLGGCDFDEALAHWIADQLCAQGYDLGLNPDDANDQRVLRRLTVLAEKAKRALSDLERYQLIEASAGIADHSGQPVEIDLEITRADFESLIAPQIGRMLDLTRRVSERASSIDHRLDLSQIVLTGGSSRIPLLSRRLEDEFGIAPTEFEPDLAVVLGTALVARGDRSEAQRIGPNVLPRAISVALEDGVRVIAPEGTALPHRAEIQIKTIDGETPIRLPLVDGMRPIGEIIVEGIPPGLAVGTNVRITLMLGEDFGVEARAEVEGAVVPSSFELRASRGAKPRDADSPPRLEPPIDVFLGLAAETEQLLASAKRNTSDIERNALRRELQAIRDEADGAYAEQNVARWKASFDRLTSFSALAEDLQRNAQAADADASDIPPPSVLIQRLEYELRRIEQQAQSEGRFREFAGEFVVASDSLKAIDPNAPQSLQEIEAWVRTRFTPLREKVFAPEPPGLHGGGSHRSPSNTSWGQPQARESSTHDLQQARAAIERGEHYKAIGGSTDPDEPQREWLDNAKRAAETGDWDTAIGYARRLMREPGGRDRNDIARQVLAPLLANRAVARANRAVESLKKGVADPTQLKPLIAGLKAGERDLIDARALEPSRKDLQPQVIEIRQVLDRCEVELHMLEARQAIERGDWDSAVDRLRDCLRTAPESEKASVQQNLARCLFNRAARNANIVAEQHDAGMTDSSARWEALPAIESVVRDLNEVLRLDPSNEDAARYLEHMKRALGAIGAPTTGVKPGRASSWLSRVFGKGRRGASQPTLQVTETHQINEPISTERTGTPGVPGAVDNVHFSVTAPPLVLPGAVFILTVWAYLERQRAQVIERAREELGGGEIYIQSKGPVPVPEGAVLTVRLRVEGLIVDDGEDTILWTGEIGEAGFPVSVPQEAVHGPKHGLATIHVDGLQIAKIHFAINVGATAATAADLGSREERHRTAFASYASEDRDRVVARVQGLKKAGVDVFMDIVNLRAGELWEEALWREIPARDIFYLFWSEHAARSEYVEKEWRYALQTKGLEFIDPVPLVSPDIVKPPPELAGKHFNDALLAFMKGQSVRR